ncbi:Cytochrome b5 [Aspergillus sclerotialis]|uniref:Cytochrome b5 n=1 Tax=Aspergillus sclerotialis TaxID=2070753 RepID=A0A3A2ZUX3_9EURO|nr:Cytochrome b5 [Aspergillus sclerotialis]
MATSTPKETYSQAEVAQHNSTDDLWIVIDQNVYDLSNFVEEHPGGSKVLLSVAGTDATKKFKKYHRDAILNRYKERLQVGVLEHVPTKESRSHRFFGSFLKKR